MYIVAVSVGITCMYVCGIIILFYVWITVLSETIAVDGKARAGLPSRRMLWDILKPQASAVSIGIQCAWISLLRVCICNTCDCAAPYKLYAFTMYILYIVDS